MDREKLLKLADLLGEILWSEPSDEELDYDETKIELYDALHNLKISLEENGFQVEY